MSKLDNLKNKTRNGERLLCQKLYQENKIFYHISYLRKAQKSNFWLKGIIFLKMVSRTKKKGFWSIKTT